MIHPVVCNPVLNPKVGILNPPRWGVGKNAPEGAILHWDADIDAFSEQTGGPHTFNHAVLAPQYQLNADGSYTDVGAKPAVDVFGGEKWLRSCGAVTNLLPSGAETFTTANWAHARSSLETNDYGSRIVGTTDNGTHYIRMLGISGTYNCQIAARPGEITQLAIGTNWTSMSGAVFDLSSGIVLSSKGSASNPSILQLPNGWWLCSVTLTFQSATNETYFDILLAKNGGVSFVSAVTEGLNIRNPQYTTTSYPVPYVPPGVTQPASNATTTNGMWFALPDGSPLWQALTGAPLTLATRVRMGVGSGDLVGDKNSQRIITPGFTENGLYYYRGDTVSYLPVATDGGGTWSAKSREWPRGQVINIVLQVFSGGTQWRSGSYLDGASSIEWNPTRIYDGSFNPSALYRLMLGYNNPYPMWFNKITTWKEAVSDARILEAMA